MALRMKIKTLYFLDGIPMLGGRQSIASEPTPGLPTFGDIERTTAGFIVTSLDGQSLYFVPDARVSCARVEWVDAEEAAPETPARGKGKAA